MSEVPSVTAIAASSAGEPNGVATLESSGKLIEKQLPNLVVSGNTMIDLCRQYGAKPGTDITTILQEAVTKLCETGGGTIYCSQAGVYQINGAVKSGEVLEHKYAGQILFPARPISESRISIKILGATPPTKKWDATTTEPPSESGVVFLSNATEGYILDAVPGTQEEAGTSAFTNIFVSFENVTLRTPNNSGAGKINGGAFITMATREVVLDTNTAGNKVKLVEGGNAALVTPRYDNGAYVRISSTHIIGGTVGINHSEHTLLDYVTINSCMVGIKASGNGYHSSIYGKVLVAKCPVVLQSKTGESNGGTIRGTIDAECSTGGEFALKYMVEDAESKLTGDLAIFCLKAPTAGWPVLGARNLNLSNLNFGAIGWMGTTPIDTFTRVIDRPELLGSADSTSHLWGIVEGKATTEKGVAKSEEAGASTMVNVRYFLRASRESRIIRTLLTTGGSSYNIQIVANRTVKNGNYLFVKITAGAVSINKDIAGTNTELAKSSAGAVVEKTEYEILTKIVDEIEGRTVYVYVNGKKVAEYSLTSTDLEQLTDTPGETLKQDGLRWVKDATSSVKAFAVYAGRG